MINRIVRHGPAPIVVERLARVRVEVEARQITARNIQANAMSALEDQRCGVHLDGEGIYGAGLHQRGMGERIAIARPQDAVPHVQD